jgi:DNA helicase II / ATP-dependent DNA helicase PcrA
MQSAIFNSEIIHLESYPRDLFHHLYLAGKREKLVCSVCHKPVQMYFSMKKAPYFFHSYKENRFCEPISSPVNEKIGSIEQGGFRLPVNRSINDSITLQSSSTFRKAKLLPIRMAFTSQNKRRKHTESIYIERLLGSGVNLDNNQIEAIMNITNPLLILSGAGSGKTRVLTAKTAYMISEKQINPSTMMLVTFTAKAAAEMKSRLSSYPEVSSKQINSLVNGTFHSIFYRILMHHEPNKWAFENILKKDWQKEKILREAGKEISLDEKDFAFDIAIQQIGFWKNSLILPDKINAESKWEEQVSFLYQHYEKSKQKAGLFDFDDMLIGCYELFNNHPSLLERYQQRFQYFLIDEFQDINKVQYELIKQLSSLCKMVFAVGDDDQSIYGFRGSNPEYLIYFDRDFPHSKVIRLDENYRSSHEIVTIANDIISENKKRQPKQMKAQFEMKQPPIIFFPLDEEEEATMIVNEIQESIAKGAKPEDFAVLFRTNVGSRAVFERLVNSSLPFKITQDTESFYDRYIPRIVLAYMRLSMNEDDIEAINVILPSLFLKQNIVRDIKANSILQDCSFIEALSSIKTGYHFQDKKLRKLPGLIRSLKHCSPSAAINIISKDMGLEEYLKKRGSEGNKLEKGSDDLKDLKVACKSFVSIQEFLLHAEHISAKTKELKKTSTQIVNAISLSTIHRAKGLEYNSVFIIGVVDGSIPHEFALEEYRNGIEDALEEERRLLYVAMTRAKNKLYLSVPENRRGKLANRSRFLNKVLKKTK